MATRVNYGGVVVAGIGFFLTRFTVTLAIYEDPVRFYLAGVAPLVLGLGLAAFGVALAVADVEPSHARTTATWCLAGTGAMLVLVLLTLLGSTPGGMPDVATVRSRTYLSNFLIGGSVGGTLTGLYASRTRRHRDELRQQASRLEVLNRLLRHEILNATAVIRGYAGLGDDGVRDAREVIEARTDAIERTIEEVKYLTRSAGAGTRTGAAVDVEESLAASVRTVRDRHPDADISIAVDAGSEPLVVRANERIEQVFTQLIQNAVVHTTDSPSVEVSVTATPRSVGVSVSDDGPGLPPRQRALLETGDIDEFDNPETGFGLNVVRLLVESYRGTIETEVGAAGTTVTVTFPRTAADGGPRPIPSDLTRVRPAVPHLVVTLGAAVLAGVFYGVAAEQVGGDVGIIGVLYGAEHTVVGWITHEFHSVVFGFVFAGLVSIAPARYRTHLPAHVAIGTAWALVLWFVAAGIVSAVWLRLLGIPAPIPSLSPVTFAGHLAWGVSLGVLTAWGYEHVTPWVARAGERLGRGSGGV
jgi:signal transduction histidine kinase